MPVDVAQPITEGFAETGYDLVGRVAVYTRITAILYECDRRRGVAEDVVAFRIDRLNQLIGSRNYHWRIVSSP